LIAGQLLDIKLFDFGLLGFTIKMLTSRWLAGMRHRVWAITYAVKLPMIFKKNQSIALEPHLTMSSATTVMFNLLYLK
jgi:hypothetical protein